MKFPNTQNSGDGGADEGTERGAAVAPARGLEMFCVLI